jgi:hypothetical protein
MLVNSVNVLLPHTTGLGYGMVERGSSGVVYLATKVKHHNLQLPCLFFLNMPRTAASRSNDVCGGRIFGAFQQA